MRPASDPPIFVIALVGQRRDETVQQIAVREMQLDGVEAKAHRALGGVGETPRVTRAMSSSVMARGVCHPGPNGSAEGAMVGHGSSSCRQRLGALPGTLRGCLASGMRELNAEFRRADALAMGDDALERVLAGVGIKTEAAVGDAADAARHGSPRGPAFRRRNSPACRDASCANRWRRRHWRCTGTSGRRRCGLAASESASLMGENKALVMAGHMRAGGRQRTQVKARRSARSERALEW